MNKIRIIFIGALAVLTVSVSGCVVAMGNRDGKEGTATLGQELIDLQKAKDAGALSEAEYDLQKHKLIEHRSGK